MDGGQKDSFEFSEWIVTSSSHNVRIVIVYRPPYSEDHKVSTSVFFDEFSDYLESLLLCKEQLLITGDFNIHSDKGHQDPISSIFLNFLESFNLQQRVTMPTHLHGHILDLITRMSEKLVHGSPQIDRYISDHAAILCWLSSYKPDISVKSITYRKLKSIDMNQMKSDLKDSDMCAVNHLYVEDLSGTDLNAMALKYNATLVVTKTLRPTVPWYNELIVCARKLRRKAERKWRRTRTMEDLQVFKTRRNYVTFLLNKARRQFYSEFMEENSVDQRKLFRAANEILGIKENLVPTFPDQLNKTLLANDIARFFVKKIDDIRNEIESTCAISSDLHEVPPDPKMECAKVLRSFKQLS